MKIALVMLRVAASQHHFAPQQVGIPKGKISAEVRDTLGMQDAGMRKGESGTGVGQRVLG